MKIPFPELVEISALKPHPKNYRHHGEDQLNHIVKSIEEHGFYRNIVIAKEGTILAGHGVVEAAQKMGIEEVPAIRLDIDPDDKRAFKVLIGDNEISHLGEVNDRLLTDMLKDLTDFDDLLGTGFDQMMLANLVFVTRPETEIADFNAAREWVGLPAYEEKDESKKDELSLTIVFKTTEDRNEFIKQKELKISSTVGGKRWSTKWPFEERHDQTSVKFIENT